MTISELDVAHMNYIAAVDLRDQLQRDLTRAEREVIIARGKYQVMWVRENQVNEEDEKHA